MSDPRSFEERAEAVLAFTYRGVYHVQAWVRGRVEKQERFWVLNVIDGLATYDYDELTRLVVAAHDLHVRVEICASGPHRLKLLLHDRKREDESMTRKHPRLEEHAAAMRKHGAGWMGPTDAEPVQP